MNRALRLYTIHALIGMIGSTVLGLAWAVIFWNSSLFIWHWAVVPLGMIYVGVAGIVIWAKCLK